MNRTLSLTPLLAAALLAAGCSSSHSMSEDGGPGGDAEPPRDGDMPPPDDAGRDAEPPPPPPECGVETDRDGPFETTLRFVNESDEELWVQSRCALDYSMHSCASDYEEITIRAGCTVDCDEGGGTCIACAPCMISQDRVGPGSPVESTWGGMIYSFDETPSSCRCHDGRVAPPARYEVRIPVYASEEDARNGDVLREVTHEFELPAEGDLVIVPLGR